MRARLAAAVVTAIGRTALVFLAVAVLAVAPGTAVAVALAGRIGTPPRA